MWIPINRELSIPLTRQIYDHLRSAILQGQLQGRTQLPASRELAANLGVSRNVVLQAYEQLEAEGFLQGRRGSGTYVAEGACLQRLQATAQLPYQLLTGDEQVLPDVIDFRSGVPALDQFPRQLWGRLTKQVCADVPDSLFGYGTPEGCPQLRSVLTSYLLRTRGVCAHPDQIVITSGAAQAIVLIARLLLTPGDSVALEDPVTREVKQLFSVQGASFIPIPVDEYGLSTLLLSTESRPRFTFVTPSHQFPMGGVLPIQRRIELIQFARATNSLIVEDDYDSEFRYEGSPVSSLQGLAPEQVIYVGTFSKILSPALRLGYLVLPVRLVERCRQLKRLDDLHTSSLEQLVLARMIEEGYLERHIAKMKNLYRKRRDALVGSLSHYFFDQVKVLGASCGLHLVAEFTGIQFDEERVHQVQQGGVKIYPVELHAMIRGKHSCQVILGYGNLDKEEIETGVERLKRVLAI